jgi:hypothetical protein
VTGQGLNGLMTRTYQMLEEARELALVKANSDLRSPPLDGEG